MFLAKPQSEDEINLFAILFLALVYLCTLTVVSFIIASSYM